MGMIEVVTEEMHGSDRASWPETIASEPWLVWQFSQLERNGALFGAHGLVRFKKRLTPPTLSETRCYANTQ